eukprot:364950-Chlamydomonas_euryale.AAC.2
MPGLQLHLLPFTCTQYPDKALSPNQQNFPFGVSVCVGGRKDSSGRGVHTLVNAYPKIGGQGAGGLSDACPGGPFHVLARCNRSRVLTTPVALRRFGRQRQRS